jgi:hypothetical protein
MRTGNKFVQPAYESPLMVSDRAVYLAKLHGNLCLRTQKSGEISQESRKSCIIFEISLEYFWCFPKSLYLCIRFRAKIRQRCSVGGEKEQALFERFT